MPDRTVAVDVSRLLTSLRFPRPSGVERLELGYAETCGADGPGVVLTPIGPRVVSAPLRRRIAAAARHRWQEDGKDSLEHELAPYVAFLQGRPDIVLPPPRPLRPPLALLPGLAIAALRRPAGSLPKDAAYLHTSFFRLEREAYFAWLERRRDVRAVFTVYDLLPLDHPDFFRPGEAQLHAHRLATAARYGARLVTASETVAEKIRARLHTLGGPAPPVEIVGLPVDGPFFEAPLVPALAAQPYFVMCGTIEPRKNHHLVLDIWVRFAKDLGNAAPRLIIAGRRGWRNDQVFAALDNRQAFAGLILEAPHVSTRALAALLKNSRGLLSPSFAEGYGLPVAEALACGAPALIADTPVYRELWSAAGTLLPLDKPEAWNEAILAAAHFPQRQLNHLPAHVMTWPHHAQYMERLLAGS